jgi:hypothetical protein
MKKLFNFFMKIRCNANKSRRDAFKITKEESHKLADYYYEKYILQK